MRLNGKEVPANGVDPEDEDEDEDDRLLVPDQAGGIVAPIWRKIWTAAAAVADADAAAGVLQLENLEQLLCGILWWEHIWANESKTFSGWWTRKELPLIFVLWNH